MSRQKESNMRTARKRLGLNQLDLSKMVGCTESLITKIETGRCDPDSELRGRIAGALGIKTWEVGT